MAWEKDADERDSEKEQARMRRKRKRGGALPPQFKKKKAPPFGRESKVEGGNARRRADMRRQYGGRIPRPGLGGLGTFPGGAGGPRVGEDIARRTEETSRPYTEKKFLEGRDEAMPKNYKDGGDSGKWIGKARASMERRGTVGSLRKAMGAKEGQKIPTSSLQAKKAQAKRTGNTAMMRKVNFALNVRKADGGAVARGEEASSVEMPPSEDEKKDRYLGIMKKARGGAVGNPLTDHEGNPYRSRQMRPVCVTPGEMGAAAHYPAKEGAKEEC